MQSCLKKAKAGSNLYSAKIGRVKTSHCGLLAKTIAWKAGDSGWIPDGCEL